MSQPNNINNYYYVPQLSYPEDFNFEDTNSPVQMSINLQSQSRIQNSFPSAVPFSLSDNVDVMSMNNMNYEDTGTYTGNRTLYQGNFLEDSHGSNVNTMNGQLNIPSHNQVETHTSASFQTFSDPYFDTTNDGPTDNNSQYSGVDNNTCVSYILVQMTTSNEYVVMREERTQSIVGRISAADFNQMLAFNSSVRN